MLKLNGDKSDVMVLNGPRRPRIELPPITICDVILCHTTVMIMYVLCGDKSQ